MDMNSNYFLKPLNFHISLRISQLRQTLGEENADMCFQRGRQKTETVQENRSLFVKETVSTPMHRYMSIKVFKRILNIVDLSRHNI